MVYIHDIFLMSHFKFSASSYGTTVACHFFNDRQSFCASISRHHFLTSVILSVAGHIKLCVQCSANVCNRCVGCDGESDEERQD